MKKINLLMLLAVTLFLAGNSFAQKNQNKPVTSTIQDNDANFAPYSLQSDLLGTYKNGVNSVVSQIQAIGDWELDMLASPTRKVYINFGEPVPDTNPNNLPPPANGYYPVRFLAQCPADLRNLGSGGSQNCKMIIAVNVGADRYSIRFGYVAGTSQPLWTCGAVTNLKCGSWRMQSDPNGSGKVIAQLLKITTAKGKTVEEARGKYYFSFDVGVTNL
jgi:hypothetical protein